MKSFKKKRILILVAAACLLCTWFFLSQMGKKTITPDVDNQCKAAKQSGNQEAIMGMCGMPFPAY